MAFKNLIAYTISEGTDINIFQPVYFVASKLDAFNDRGDNDGRTSQDFEDIIFVFDNRENIWDELLNSEGEVSAYISERFEKLLAEPHIEEWISAHLDPQTAGIRTRKIIDGISKVAQKQS